MAGVALRQVRVPFSLERDPAAVLFGQSGAQDDVRQALIGQANFRDGLLWALDGVDMDVQDGESVSVLGPSGCGKSTLLRVVAGLILLDPPRSGRIAYGDQDWTALSAKERRVGLVFQNYALYPHMHSKKNLGFFFKMHKREEEIDERVELTSKIMGVGFDQLLDRKPKALSGGQQQRVAIARCIVRDPSVFLFDEPLSNLDAKLRARTRVEIKRLLRRFSITTLYVTHDQTEAQAMGDRIAVMRAGQIQQFAPYREIYDNPANMFVAGFVGAPPMNLMEGVAEQGGVRVNGHLVDLRHDALGTRPGERVHLGVRPEAIELFHAPQVDTFPVTVDWVEAHFSQQIKEVTFNVTGVRVVAKRPIAEEWERDGTVHVRVPKASAYVFAADEARLL
ncbi:MAG: ABC transporter ATP-binding protein [Actinobacteria bacterium]|nr:ABC transporter ATP-binding protein [Actinomycetota bacterium]